MVVGTCFNYHILSPNQGLSLLSTGDLKGFFNLFVSTFMVKDKCKCALVVYKPTMPLKESYHRYGQASISVSGANLPQLVSRLLILLSALWPFPLVSMPRERGRFQRGQYAL
jgi:hypothetical protein